MMNALNDDDQIESRFAQTRSWQQPQGRFKSRFKLFSAQRTPCQLVGCFQLFLRIHRCARWEAIYGSIRRKCKWLISSLAQASDVDSEPEVDLPNAAHIPQTSALGGSDPNATNERNTSGSPRPKPGLSGEESLSIPWQVLRGLLLHAQRARLRRVLWSEPPQGS